MPANMNTLPPEIHALIARHLFDPHDLAGTLSSIKNLRLANSSLNNGVNVAFPTKAIKLVKATLLENNGTLDAVPIQPMSADNRKLLNWQHLTVEADFIPLISVEGRSEIVAGIMRHPFDAPERAFSNLILNIDYLKPDEIQRIAKHVCDTQPFLGYSDNLVRQLIIEAEHLTPEDRSALAKASCALPVQQRQSSLEFWVHKMHLLGDDDQFSILAEIYQDRDEMGRSLEYFAEHADKLSERSRSSLTERVIALADDKQGKWEALSRLAEHLPALGELDRGRVARHIIDNYTAPIEEVVETATWYSSADFWKVEALHFLSVHEQLLEPRELNRVVAFIEDIVERSDESRFPSQAQLITHLSAEQREGFVGALLNQDGEQRLAMYALIARMKDLDKRERRDYVSHVAELSYGEVLDEAVEYNIRNNLEYFTPKQRTKLIERQIEIILYNKDPIDAGPAFADMAQNAKYLRAKDIYRIVGAADRVVRRYLDNGPWEDDERGASIGSCSGHATRCLARWASEAISNPLAAQWIRAVERRDRTEPNMADDGESHRASRRPSEGRRSASGSQDVKDGVGGRLYRLSRSRSASISKDVERDVDRENEVQSGRSAGKTISVSDDNEFGSSPSAGPSRQMSLKRKRDDHSGGRLHEDGSIQEPTPKRRQFHEGGRDRERSSSIEL